jgi:HK97 family phage major capsid protein
MPTPAQELREKRSALISEAVKLMNDNKDNVTAEIREKSDKMVADAEAMASDITRFEKVEGLDAEMRATTRPPMGQPGAGLETDSAEARAKKEEAAFRNYITSGTKGEPTAEERKFLRQYNGELRDLSVGTTTAGGFLIPAGYQKELEVAQKQWGGAVNAVRQLNTDSGNPLPWPTANDVSQQSVVLTEAAQVSESDMVFGQVTISVDEFTTGLVKVSNQLLQDSAFDLGAFVRDSFAVRAARGINTAITAGTTNCQSILSAATAGATSAAPTAVAYPDFVNAYAALEPAYIDTASWMMSNATRVYLMGLVDTLNRPIFTTSVNSGLLETILGRPIVINNSMPAIAATNVAVLFGDFSKYVLRNAKTLEVVKLGERYADFNQTAFVGFHRHGGKLIDAGTHPIVKLTQHV